MYKILYFIIAIFSTTIGSVSGMGGGIIIKPVVDTIGQYDAATIGVLSAFTVLTMSIVSIGRQIQKKVHINRQIALFIVIGSILGGFLGQQMLAALISVAGKNTILIQNSILVFVVISVFIYMSNKQRIRSLGKDGALSSMLAGTILGMLSSFLGIGGGPINVALLIFVFSFDTKNATIYSIITIMFAQISKLLTVIAGGGLSQYNLSILPYMLVGAVLGGFVGTYFNQKFSAEFIEKTFNAVQIMVMAICVFNIVKALAQFN